jgi:phage tail sheath protein FI
MPNGIKVLPTKNASATATIITSTTVIGLVGSASLVGIDADIKAKLDDVSQSGLLKFGNAEEALEIFASQAGTIREDLWDIKSQNVKSPVVISLVELTDAHADKEPQVFYEDAEFKSAIVLAIGNLQKARTLFGTKVRIAIAGYFSHDTTVRNALDSFYAGTKTVGIVDLYQSNKNDATVALQELGSMRYLAFPFYRRAWSVYENATVLKPNSAVVAGHIARWDALLGEFGPCFDHANKLIYDVEGVAIPLTYEEGEDTCDVNTLVNAGGCLLLNDDGNRLYNFETPSDDARFNKLETIRFFDLINENMQKSLKKHKHRPVTDVLTLAKADAEAFLNKAIRNGAAIGAKVWWSDKNSPEEIAAGILYMDYDAGNNVGVRAIVIQPYATNDYYTVEVK